MTQGSNILLSKGPGEAAPGPLEDGKRPRVAQQNEEGQSEAVWRPWSARLRGQGLIWGGESYGQLLSRVGLGQARIPTTPLAVAEGMGAGQAGEEAVRTSVIW